MKKVLVVLMSLLCVQLAMAAGAERADYVAVPAVPATSSVTELQAGLIIYDLSSDTFKGLNASGTWVQLSNASGNTVVSTGTEKLNRAYITGPCTSSPCTITSQSGSWISSMTRSSTGNYTVNFQTGIFSGAPSCSMTGYQFCTSNSATSSALSISCYGLSSGTLVASDLGSGQLICVGPQ
jgi:hypothetical protein